MATIRGYIGASLDGYIASPDGTLDWLTKYEGIDAVEFSFDTFIAGIRTVVMGRATYDAIVRFDVGWPYYGKRAIIVTTGTIETPIGPVDTWSESVDALVAHLRALDDGDVWMVGGGRLQQAFIERGALDDLLIFVVPEILGGGIPLFPPNGFARTLSLVTAKTLAAGCVCLLYDLKSPPAGPG